MTTYRTAKARHSYTRIDNAVLEDARLGAESLALLCHLLGKPDTWVLNPSALRRRFGWGRDRWRKILGELERIGYVTRRPIRTGSRITATHYDIHERPFAPATQAAAQVTALGPDFQALEPLGPDFQAPGNPPLSNKLLINPTTTAAPATAMATAQAPQERVDTPSDAANDSAIDHAPIAHLTPTPTPAPAPAPPPAVSTKVSTATPKPDRRSPPRSLPMTADGARQQALAALGSLVSDDRPPAAPTYRPAPTEAATSLPRAPAGIPADWQPDPLVYHNLRALAVPDAYTREAVAEFVTYWRDRADASVSWNAKFLRHIQRQWQRQRHTWTAAQQPSTRPDPRSFVEKHTDPSWRRGL